MSDYEPYRAKRKITELKMLRTGTTYQVIDMNEKPFLILYEGESFPEAIEVYEQKKCYSVVITETKFSVYR
jgi:beta-galactosidase beta subunit